MEAPAITKKFSTVGDLFDALAELNSDPEIDIYAMYVGGPNGEAFDGFRVTGDTLSDGSAVYDFTLSESDLEAE